METLKNMASVAMGVLIIGIGIGCLYLWNVPWYAFIVPLVIFGAGFTFIGVGLSDWDI